MFYFAGTRRLSSSVEFTTTWTCGAYVPLPSPVVKMKRRPSAAMSKFRGAPTGLLVGSFVGLGLPTENGRVAIVTPTSASAPGM
jgi:hypothetical protein